MRVFKRNGFPILSGFDAITIGSWIFIRPSAANATLEHEKVHVKQFKDDWLFPIKYLLSSKYRYEKEVEAYKTSIKYGVSADSVVYLLRDKYSTHVTTEQIHNDLKAGT